MSSLRVAHQTFHCSKGSGLTRFPERDLNRSMFIFLGKRTLKQPISPRQLLLLPCLHSVQGLVLGQNSEVKQDEGCDLWGNTVSLEPGNPAPKKPDEDSAFPTLLPAIFQLPMFSDLSPGSQPAWNKGWDFV